MKSMMPMRPSPFVNQRCFVLPESAILISKPMPDARGLHCPNCGAAADPAAGRCPYCKARLATMSCPSCFALMFEGSAYCPQCGAARSRQESSTVAGTCPGCNGDLEKVAVGKTSLFECASCDGAWVDAQAFEALCADG
jgi:uncharacterized protein with PIN domain